MIHIIEGRIGSGKTYWCVAHILREYFEYDKRFFEWMPKKEVPNIFTNIQGLKVGNVFDLQSEIRKKGSLEKFFAVDPVTCELLNQDLKGSIIIVDEAQGPSFFHRKYSNPHVMLFFQYHRHFGCEVFLCTQDVKSLCPELRELPEYHIRVKRQSLQLGNYFAYTKYYDEEKGATTRIKKDQLIFDVYKSQEKGVTPQKVPSALMRYLYLMVGGVLVFVIGGYLIQRSFARPAEASKSSQKVEERKITYDKGPDIRSSLSAKPEAARAAEGAGAVAKAEICRQVVGNYAIYDANEKLIKKRVVSQPCPEVEERKISEVPGVSKKVVDKPDVLNYDVAIKN